MITKAELEALQLMVRAGKIVPNAEWRDVIPEVKSYIIGLAKRLQEQNPR